MVTNTLFWILAVVCAGAAAAMIVSRNPGHNALFLVLSFSALGGIFGLLDAPFAAAVQILVYAGAIMVLFLFVVMMIDPRFGVPPERRKRAKVLGAVMAAVLLVEIGAAVAGLPGSAAADGEPAGTPRALGRLLFTEYAYPFEIASVLILAALVGSVVLGKKAERKP